MPRAAASAAPPRAILVWTDNLNLFTELPSPTGSPMVLRYPLTTLGLSAMLGIIKTHSYDGVGPNPSIPEPTNQPGTFAQRLNAATTLRRMGVLK